MDKRLAEIEQRLGREHHDICQYVKHVFAALDIKVDEHRKLVASNALAGIKVKGEEEKVYYETIYEMKKMLLDVLVKTTEDFEHLGDKRWEKKFKDGVN